MSNRGVQEIQKYRELINIPALTHARIAENGIAVTSTWSQRNLERGKSVKISRTCLVSQDLVKLHELTPNDVTNEYLTSVSPSQKHKALIRTIENKEGRKQFFEIWSNGCLSHTTELSSLELHDEVYTDGDLGVLEWSPDETKLIYIAERKEPKSDPFHKKKSMKQEIQKDADATKGEQFLYRQDWGEQYEDRKKSVIVQHNRINDSFSILEGVPEDFCPVLVTWAPDGSYIAGVALETSPRKLGLIYCSNRPSHIFTLDFNQLYNQISLAGKAVIYPRFTPDGETLIWFERESGGAHSGCFSLMKKNILKKTANIDTVVPIVNREQTVTEGREFFGIFNPIVPSRCWASQNRLLLSVQQKHTINTYSINIDLGVITELEYSNGSQIVLDVFDDIILVNRRNFFLSDKLGIGRIPLPGKEQSIRIEELTESKKMDYAENFTYTYLDLKHNVVQDEVDSFSAIYIGPKAGEVQQVPLLIFPHGGPHSAFANNLFLELSMYNSFGFAVLLINYRGSTGVGEDSIKFLQGKVGTADVADCMLAATTALKQFPWLNPKCVGLVGGSHGGFLVTHLSGQFPDMFKVVVARNPVIDIATMSTVSDIPDWSYIECGFSYTQAGQPNEEQLLALRKASPIEHSHKVKAPTLLQIGSNDKRVPPSQGIEYYHRLRANGKIVRMNIYEDNHAISSVHNEVDNIINSLLWIQQYTS